MNHFQRLNEVKELKILFFAQRANTRKQAPSKRLLPCDALAPTAQNRASARCVNDTSAHRRPAAILSSVPDFPGSSWVLVQAKRACAVQLAHPPSPVFAESRPPVSNVACLISWYLLSTCMYHMFSHITFLGYNHMNSRASVLLDSLLSERIIRYHMCPWGRLIPGYRTRFFLQRGCCCQGKEVVPVDHIRGKGSVPVVPLGRKLV